MGMRARLFGAGVGTLIVCLGLGFAWGASGRTAALEALDDTRQQLDLADARARILDARVSLYNINFGDASRHLEEAKAPLRRVRERYQDIRQSGSAASIDAAMSQVDEAQRLAGRLDPSANTKAGDALEAIKVATAR